MVVTAHDVRRAEFATGRALLRRMLQTEAPIGRSAKGAPAWPPGLVGSLAHDRQHAVAAIGSADQYRAIGIDIEPLGATDDDELRESVLRADDPDIDPVAAFVMKEAAYKAWSDLGGEIVGPLAVRLRVDGDNFTAEMPSPQMTVHGTLVNTGEAWLAIAAVTECFVPGTRLVNLDSVTRGCGLRRRRVLRSSAWPARPAGRARSTAPKRRT